MYLIPSNANFACFTTSTTMIAYGPYIRMVLKVLRHNDIRTTLCYAHVSDKTKREKYGQCLTLQKINCPMICHILFISLLNS